MRGLVSFGFDRKYGWLYYTLTNNTIMDVMDFNVMKKKKSYVEIFTADSDYRDIINV